MLGRGAVTFAALLLVGSYAAGCIGKDAGVAETQSVVNNSTLLPNQTVAPNGAGAISAFNETNKTETKGVGAMMHTHDYWHGKERIDNVAWISSGLIPLPLMPCAKSDNSCTVGGSTPGTDTYPPGTAIADFDLAPPPAMGMIYEGTKTVEVTLTHLEGPNQCVTSPLPCAQGTPPSPAGQVFFDYLAANDEPGHFHHGGELKPGQPFKIDIKPTDADMPHQTKSLWVFRIYSNSEMVWFTFNISISLVKGYDVVNWPPHPNLYADHNMRVVYDGPVKLASKGSTDGDLFGSDAGWLSPQRVISWGTDTVQVDITNVQFNQGVPGPEAAPKRFELQFRNASSPFLMANFPNWISMSDNSSDGRSYHFTIDLTKDRGDAYDTPYAQYSRWGFRLLPIYEDATGCSDSDVGAYLSGCQWYPWDMSYQMKITAIGHSTENGVPAGAM